MAGYVLVLAILILGGTIATLGDRIGTKVGKSRLSIFNLRPRNTATVITIATGGMIAASTLGILLATSSQLQDGLFRLDSIRADLRNAQTEKEKIEAELNATKAQRDQEQQNLAQVNNSLSAALFRQSRTQAQLRLVEQKFQTANQELAKVQAQEQELNKKIANLSADSQKLTAERDQLNQDLIKITSDRQQLRDRVTESQKRLGDLENQRQALNSELKVLETNREQLAASIQALRRGNVAIQSEQVLTAAVINGGLSMRDLRLAVFQVLQQADQNARVLLDFPAESRPVIQLTEAQIENLLSKLSDGNSYILRILSAGNYLRKENNVAILADITPNREVFKPNELIASLQLGANLSDRELEEQLDRLFLLVSFRARQQGVLPNPFTGKVGNFPQSALFELVREFKLYKSAVEIQARAKETIFTGSPLTLTLVILENGVEIRRFG